MVPKIKERVKSWRSDYERMCEAEPEIRNMMSFDELIGRGLRVCR